MLRGKEHGNIKMGEIDDIKYYHIRIVDRGGPPMRDEPDDW